MGQSIRSAETCVGHAVAIVRDLKRLGYQDLLEVEPSTSVSLGWVEELADPAGGHRCGGYDEVL